MLKDIGTQTIETERLLLRRFEYCDTESVFKNWASDEDVQALYSEPVYKSIEEVRELLSKYIDIVKVIIGDLMIFFFICKICYISIVNIIYCFSKNNY